MIWFYAFLVFAGIAFLTLFPLLVGKCIRAMEITDPEYCEAKALEFAGDAYRNREG